MSIKKLSLAGLMGLAIQLTSPAAHCMQWAEWLGPELKTFSAEFDQYELDRKTGEMSQPLKGEIMLERPGLASIRIGERSVILRNGQIEASDCGKCPVIALAAEKILNPSLRDFIASGANAAELIASTSHQYADSQATRFSLQPAGIPNATMTLWANDGKPATIEIDLGDDKKTILQLYLVRKNGFLVKTGKSN